MKNNNKGIALFLVLTAITVLTLVLGDFLFETHINKMKSYNIQDREQAKLNAESGLALAMTRLRLYQAAYNYLEQNQTAKDMVGMTVINKVWDVPFLYPIPVISSMDVRQKGVLEKFSESVILEGEVSTQIENISNRINLNLLRVEAMVAAPQAQDQSSTNQEQDQNQPSTISQVFIDLIEAARQTQRENRTITPELEEIDPEYLVSSLKFYISDPESEYDDPFREKVASDYSSARVAPKFAPLGSSSELNQVLGWTPEIIELIENEITVHGALMIDVDQITQTLLKLFAPQMTVEQVKKFYEWKNDPKVPQVFTGIESLKNYLVTVAGVVRETDFDEKVAQLTAAGLIFGASPTLFRILSTGSYQRSSLSLQAYVTLPPLPTEPVLKAPPPAEEDDKSPESENDKQSDEESKKTVPATQLLSPRIVEILYL